MMRVTPATAWQGWEAIRGRLSLTDTFEPYEQTRLELFRPEVSPIISAIDEPEA